MEKRYSYLNFFQELYQKQGRQFAFQAENKEEFVIWKEKLRNSLERTLGLDRLEQIRADQIEKDQTQKGRSDGRLWVQELETVQEDGYLRKKLLLETLPKVYMPFYMLIPDGMAKQEKRPAMVAIPAHGANKDTVAGVLSHDAVCEKLKAAPKECYGKEFVKQGYVVFVPDPPGYGERLEPVPAEDSTFLPAGPQSPLDQSCKNLSQTAEAFGLSLTGLEIWDLKRLVDVACDQSFVDKDRIGCAGFSGGGQYAMWLAALDERIRLAVISGYIHNYYDSMFHSHLCSCNYAPELWKLVDISDVCAMIAPVPVFAENGIQDVLNGPRGIAAVKEEVEQARRAYRLFGKEACLVHEAPEGGHIWYGLCYDFVKRYL